MTTTVPECPTCCKCHQHREERCPLSPDGVHCQRWWDCGPCCTCGDGKEQDLTHGEYEARKCWREEGCPGKGGVCGAWLCTPETPFDRQQPRARHPMAREIPDSQKDGWPSGDIVKRIARRLEFHYTPKHGSWLNPASSTGQAMAEIEFSVLSRSCLKQRLSGEEAPRREVDALVTERNNARATINWRFNTRDARTKLHRLYPSNFTVD